MEIEFAVSVVGVRARVGFMVYFLEDTVAVAYNERQLIDVTIVRGVRASTFGNRVQVPHT